MFGGRGSRTEVGDGSDERVCLGSRFRGARRAMAEDMGGFEGWYNSCNVSTFGGLDAQGDKIVEVARLEQSRMIALSVYGGKKN